MLCKIIWVTGLLPGGRFYRVSSTWMTAIWLCHFLHTKSWSDAHIRAWKEDAMGGVLHWPSWTGQAMIHLPTPLYFTVGDFKWDFILSWGGKAGTIPSAQKTSQQLSTRRGDKHFGKSSYSNARGLHQRVWAVPIVCEHWMRTKTDWARKGPTHRYSEHIQNRTL